MKKQIITKNRWMNYKFALDTWKKAPAGVDAIFISCAALQVVDVLAHGCV